MGLGLFHSSEKTRVTLIKWLNGIQTPSSLLFFLKIVKSRVSCEHGEAARRVSLTSDAIQEVQWLSRLSKHIYLHGKDLFRTL